MGPLLLLFIIVPALELGLLIEVGGRIGVGPTILLIVATGIAGASLARAQGLAVAARLQAELNAGRVPTRQLVEGCMILAAAAMLLTPGFLTDALGLILLIPLSRRWIVSAVERRMARGVAEGRVRVHFGGFGARGGPGSPPTPSSRWGPGGPGGGPEIKDVPHTERRGDATLGPAPDSEPRAP